MTSGPLFIQLLGPSALTAIAVFVSLLPLNFFITKKRNHHQVWRLEEGTLQARRGWQACRSQDPRWCRGEEADAGQGWGLVAVAEKELLSYCRLPILSSLLPSGPRRSK